MKKVSGLELALYIIAGVFAALFIYMLISSTIYIRDYCASYGTTMFAIFGEAFKYILSQSISYLVYTLVFFFGARILKRIEKGNNLLTEVFGDADELFYVEDEVDCTQCEKDSCEGCEAANEEQAQEE